MKDKTTQRNVKEKKEGGEFQVAERMRKTRKRSQEKCQKQFTFRNI